MEQTKKVLILGYFGLYTHWLLELHDPVLGSGLLASGETPHYYTTGIMAFLTITYTRQGLMAILQTV